MTGSEIVAYISGPMTGMPDLNFPAFHKAAASLRASGYRVVNPAELDALDTQEMTWPEYMRRDIRALMDCTHIAMLPGWENSKGAKLEKHIADALGMRVMYVDHFSARTQV
jgi:hypothetical protein